MPENRENHPDMHDSAVQTKKKESGYNLYIFNTYSHCRSTYTNKGFTSCNCGACSADCYNTGNNCSFLQYAPEVS
jgi:hypothetical protein